MEKIHKRKVSKNNLIPVSRFIGFLLVITAIVGYFSSNYFTHIQLAEVSLKLLKLFCLFSQRI